MSPWQTRHQVEWLGIKLLGERPDLLFVDLVRASLELLPDLQIVKVQERLFCAWIELRHSRPLPRRFWP